MASSSNPAVLFGLASFVLNGLYLSDMSVSEAQVSEVECGSMIGRTRTVETGDLTTVVHSPLFRINLVLEMEGWPALRGALQEFADTRGWTFRDLSEVRPGTVRILYVDLCASNRLRFSVTEQRWARRDYASSMPGYGLSLPLYGDVPDEEWQRAAADMVQWLESRWPGHVRFRDRDGHLVERPDFIDAYAQP